MANLTETNQWVEGIYEFALDDWVEGGPDGVDNLPHKQLANRTQYLKGKVEELRTDVDGIIAASGDLGTHKTQAVIDHPDYSVTSIKMADGAAIDRVIGNRTINDTTVAIAGADQPTGLWSKLGYMIKSITGKANWYTAPVTTIEALNTSKLSLAGGTMTGPITLAADPTADMQAATKQYADNNGGVNLRRNSHTYAVGDICYSKTAASYKYMQCTVAGTTAATEPTWPDVGQTVTDGTVTWVVRDIRAGEQVGSIKAWLAHTPPTGWLALDTGATVSRDIYPQLWAWVQANAPLITEAEWQAQAAVQNSVGYYSTGDGSTTFRLPRLLDYLRGGLASEVGAYLSDMNKQHIHGTSSRDGGTNNLATRDGAGSVQFIDLSTGTKINIGGSIQPSGGEESRPKTVKALYCVKAFDAVTNPGLANITEIANTLQNKVNYTDFESWGDTDNGGRKFPDGRIEQWGMVNASSATSGSVVVNFPIAFPNACQLVLPVDHVATTAVSVIGWDLGATTLGSVKFWWTTVALGQFKYYAIGN